MKKYKLKKDLPLAKAGNKVYVMKNKSKNSEIYKIYQYLQEYQDNRTGKVLGSIDFKDFGEWFEEIEEEEIKTIFNLDVGNTYWCLYVDGKIESDGWYGYKDLVNAGNVFVTKEDAEKELEIRTAIMKIKRYCFENNIETDFRKIEGGKFCYLIAFDFLNNRLSISRVHKYNIFYSPIGYFSEEDAEEILNNFEEELKIILNV